MSDNPTLVTGGTGFLAAHTILRLLADGHRVRTTVRSTRRETEVRSWLAAAGADTRQLTFTVADLTSDAGWDDAMAGVEHVLHIASPFPARQPQDSDDLIVPARDGTLRVLRTAARHGVTRVVLTSSFAAIGYTAKPSGLPYDESDWTDPSGDNDPYVRSKTIAELTAWEFTRTHSGAPELTVICPVGIFGPALGPDLSSSLGIVAMLLDGKPPLLPRASFAIVDVRDVADLHLRAMVDPRAAGQRFLASSGQPVTLPEIAATLRARLGQRAARVPVRQAPDWLVRAAARVRPELGTLAGLLGEPKQISHAKATDILDWRPRSAADAVTASAESILGLGTVRTR
ncbi:epimerase [Mycobacterium sp. SWH-M5]|nr:epimerase [Mycobacterium sp. SWH-M5]